MRNIVRQVVAGNGMKAKLLSLPDNREQVPCPAEQQQFFHSIHPAFFFRIRFRIVPIR